MSSNPDEPKLLTGYQALKEFAATLTERARELDQKEREYLIVPGQSAEILQSMIENFVYTVIQLEIKRIRSEDK